METFFENGSDLLEVFSVFFLLTTKLLCFTFLGLKLSAFSKIIEETEA